MSASKGMKIGLTRDVAEVRKLLEAGDDHISHLCHYRRCSNPSHSIKELGNINVSRACRMALMGKVTEIDHLSLDTAARRHAITVAAAKIRETCPHRPTCFVEGHIWGADKTERRELTVDLFVDEARCMCLDQLAGYSNGKILR